MVPASTREPEVRKFIFSGSSQKKLVELGDIWIIHPSLEAPFTFVGLGHPIHPNELGLAYLLEGQDGMLVRIRSKAALQ